MAEAPAAAPAEPPAAPVMEPDRWKVLIQMTNREQSKVYVDQAVWDTLRIGDRVPATYAQGKYTHTIWSVEIRK